MINYKDLEYISNFIISILFLSQYNCFCNRLVVYKQAYDTSQEGSHHTPTPRPLSRISRFLRKVNIYTHN